MILYILYIVSIINTIKKDSTEEVEPFLKLLYSELRFFQTISACQYYKVQCLLFFKKIQTEFFWHEISTHIIFYYKLIKNITNICIILIYLYILFWIITIIWLNNQTIIIFISVNIKSPSFVVWTVSIITIYKSISFVPWWTWHVEINKIT